MALVPARSVLVCSGRSALLPHWLCIDTDLRSARQSHLSSGHTGRPPENRQARSYRLDRRKMFSLMIIIEFIHLKNMIMTLEGKILLQELLSASPPQRLQLY